MGAHESMEHAEHAEHASGSNKKIALLIAVIALFLALSETLGKGAQTEAISKNVEASNLWAFFQAKSIRRTVVQATAEHAKLSMGTVGDDAAKAALQKQIDDWNKTAARYRSEPETGEGSEELAKRAKHAEHRARRGHRKISPLRNRLGRLPDRHRAGVRHHHHRHDRAGLGVGRIGARRASRLPRSASTRRICCICIELSGSALSNALLCHAPRRRGIQYAAASRLKHYGLWNTGSPGHSALRATRAGDDRRRRHRASCTLLRKRWISRSVRDDQLSPSPRRISRMRCLIGWTRAAALARIARINS